MLKGSFINKQKYLYKKSYLKRRLQHDVMEDGVAYIPCRVTGMDDVISKFSVKGCESLDSDFQLYIHEFADFIPSEYPLVLEITGPKFTPEEKNTIIEIIEAEMDYQLGKAEELLHNKRKTFFLMIAGTFASGVLLGLAKKNITDVPLEFLFVLFWLFADALVRYLFIERKDFMDYKIRMGRLACMKVEFIEENNQ